MAGITLAQAETKLAFWLAIEERLGANSSHTVDNTTYTRHNLKDIQAMITTWDERVKQLSAAATNGGRAVRRVVPLS